jgi:hypothetical protein
VTPSAPPVQTAQLGFGLAEPVRPAVAVAAEATSVWGRLLRRSALLTGMAEAEREKLVAKVELLASHKGQLAADVFARRIGVLPSRVAGVVADLDEALNLDGNRVVFYDRSGNQVRIDLELFRTLYSED